MHREPRALAGALRERLRGLARAYGHAKAETGSVTFVQRWGSGLDLSPHYHVISLDGLFQRRANGLLSFTRAPALAQRPVYFYWHATGGSPGEVETGLPGATAGVRTNGGVVESFQEPANGRGESTGSVWAVSYTGDSEAADQILACAIEKGIVDTSRIHVAGYSAGGLQAGTMLYQRSN